MNPRILSCLFAVLPSCATAAPIAVLVSTQYTATVSTSLGDVEKDVTWSGNGGGTVTGLTPPDGQLVALFGAGVSGFYNPSDASWMHLPVNFSTQDHTIRYLSGEVVSPLGYQYAGEFVIEMNRRGVMEYESPDSRTTYTLDGQDIEPNLPPFSNAYTWRGNLEPGLHTIGFSGQLAPFVGGSHADFFVKVPEPAALILAALATIVVAAMRP